MTSHSNMSKFEKEKQKLIQEKCQTLLNDMLRDEDNKYCVDCDAKGPRWASWNLGIFLCIRCAGIHRNLGVHISRVKSVNLDSWTPEQVVTMQNMGNSRARALYEANMPDTLRRPQTDSTLESFIRAKYEHKKYIAKEWVQPPPVKVNWDSEIEESMRKSKEVKKSGNVTDIGPIPTPTGVSKQIKSIPTPAAKPPPVIDVSKVVASQAQAANPTSNGHSLVSTSASEDLLGLTTDTSSFITTGNIISTHEVSKNTSTSTNSGDDLGSIFLSPSSSVSTDLGKMSKESILSLYGSASTPTTPNINPFIQPGAGGSQFGNPNLQGPSGPGAGQNLAQTGGYGYNYMNTNFLGQATPHSISQQQSLGPHAGVPGGFGNQAQRNDTAQVQNQLFGLNLGNQSQVPFPNPGGNPMNSSFMTQQQQITQMGGNNVPLNTPYLANPIYPPTKPDNLPGLGNSVSQLMQPNLSGSSFWK